MVSLQRTLPTSRLQQLVRVSGTSNILAQIRVNGQRASILHNVPFSRETYEVETARLPSGGRAVPRADLVQTRGKGS
jgi:hypothetical protein